ncbi:hypothetical protein IWX91DRAFT_38063 [Phyllosticta citricarpa]
MFSLLLILLLSHSSPRRVIPPSLLQVLRTARWTCSGRDLLGWKTDSCIISSPRPRQCQIDNRTIERMPLHVMGESRAVEPNEAW